MADTDDGADDGITVSTFAERPELLSRVYEIAEDWPIPSPVEER